jgi:two-component system CheB/CheR fusion protein
MSGQSVESFETRRRTKDGRVLDVWLTVTRLVNEAGQTTSIATTERDITERNRSMAAMWRTPQDQPHSGKAETAS